MYRAFNVKITENEIDDLLKNSNQLYDNFFDIDISNKFNIQRSLENFLLPNNAIDVQSLEQDWFPSVDAHVFISHSHKDIGLVEKFEHWLYQRFGIKSFVDSRVWGYANELLKKIDDEYCVKQDTYYGLIYDYEKRNISTSHVHMILATALLKMIDKMDYVFFFNTPNSLSTNNIRQMTYSPWIYYELLLLNFIRKNSPRKFVEGEMRKSFSIESKKLTMAFPVDIKNLYKLSMTELSRWEMDVPSDEKYPTCINEIKPLISRYKTHRQFIKKEVEFMDNKLKHLEFIQNVIERMNNNSIQLKTWTILLVVGVLALAGKQESWFIMLCAMMPTGLFWLLNIHFLKIERAYRVLYDIVREKNEKDIDFSMDISNIRVPKKTMPTISHFYLPIMAALLIISWWLYFYS